MKRILLDTHSLIWFIEGNSGKLSPTARILIEDPTNEVFVSMTSFFEMTIKLSLGKLFLKKLLEGIYQDTVSESIQILPISAQHIFEYQNIPIVEDHKDPFDKLIIATAMKL
jgi:PIN domain nuclease of toxin-antitoxin system